MQSLNDFGAVGLESQALRSSKWSFGSYYPTLFSIYINLTVDSNQR